MLPAALKDAVARAVEGLSRNEIARRSQKLSEHYRGGGTSAVIADPLDVAAYLLARMPATYAATRAALAETAARMPSFAPAQCLDVGAGPGTATWAAVETWPGIEAVRLVDNNPQVLAIARRLAAQAGHSALAKPQIVTRDMDTAALAAADLVIASYSLAEIAPGRLGPTVAALWETCAGLLVLVEPGTPEGFDRIRAARTTLLAQGANIVAPCPHQSICPIVAPDWCHFSQRLPRSRDHMLAKSASVPFEDEKYSYVAAARPDVAFDHYAARIVGPVERSKAGLTLKLCEAGEIRLRVIASRDRDNFARHRRVEWGDALER
jgi:ribosomal protein RSM22 (predicted rRNA methylase)